MTTHRQYLLAAVLAALAPVASLALTIGQIDTFEDGTTAC